MLKTIRHNTASKLTVVAKLLTGYILVNEKVCSPDEFIQKNQNFEANFVAHMCSWQSKNKLTSDGIIGKNTWTAIAKNAPTCSTAKNKTSAATLALQILLDGNITPDGIYGLRTKAAVAVYQDAKKLSSDGICGPKTWNSLITKGSFGADEEVVSAPVEPAVPEVVVELGPTGGTVTPVAGKFQQPVDYKQYDSRWGSKMYSNHGDKKQTMKSSACGPTSMADIIATLVDKDKNPYDLAQLALKFGDRTYSSGTAWTFFIPHIMNEFGFVKAVQTKNLDALKACLDAGGYVVCSMGPGYWTSGGHFICAWKYDKTYIYCNDPASSKRTKQKLTEFVKERKQFFCFYPNPAVHKVAQAAAVAAQIASTVAEAAEVALTVEPAPEAVRGSAIIDISKWQGKIDFDKLKPEVALVIARAGCGSDPDVKFDEYAEAMIARDIPFGVYCYSYAGTVEKARDEAKKLVSRASKYNPLFYVMDAEESKITDAAIAAFADELVKQGAKRIGCYVAHNHYKDYGFDSLRKLWDFVWIPRYGKNNGTLDGSIKPNFLCDLWQFTSTGKIAGISGNVDMNVVTGDGHTLEWLLGGED